MTDDRIEEAVEEITEAIDRSPAMTPGSATQQQSMDFLAEIIDHCEARRQAIETDMEV